MSASTAGIGARVVGKGAGRLRHRCSRLYIAVIFVAHEMLVIAPKASGSFPAMLLPTALISQVELTQLDEQLQVHVPMEIESTVPGGRGRMAAVPAYRAGVTRHGCCTSAACKGRCGYSDSRMQTRLQNNRVRRSAAR
jgi:hypothetical protein